MDKFMGDGIMATFGAVTPSTRYAADALRAVEQIMAQVSNWQLEALRGKQPAPAAALCTAEAHRLAVEQDYRPAKPQLVLEQSRVEGLPQPVDIVVLADAAETTP